MKKYVFFRVLRSIISIFLVTTLTFIIIYSLVPRRDVFKDDPMTNKLASTPDALLNYESNGFEKMNYIDFKNTKDLISAVEKEYPKAQVSTAHTDANKAVFEKWAKANGFTIKRYKVSKDYYAIRELPLLERLGRFYGKLIQIDHPWRIHDKNNPNMKRYLKIQNDPTVGWALVGSGTKYRYQVYFNGSFPYIHQNFIKFNLGTSYPTYSGNGVSEVIGGRQGQQVTMQITTKNGNKYNTADDVYTRSYQPRGKQDDMAKEIYGDDYVNTSPDLKDPSMIGTSFRAGLVGLIIAYAVSIPMAVYMARKKGKIFDKIGTGFITVMTAVPSLAIIYVFRYMGAALLHLPDSFPTLGAGDIKSWILPAAILGILNIAGLVIWFRRYIIDQQSSDYIKFAKAKGLNEGEIYRKHIFKNAAIPIVNGIPASIIATIGGATMTEAVFAMPGMGKMLPDAISQHNNTVVIGLVFIFTVIAVFSVLLGDLLMAIVDPRIKLSTSGDD